MFCHKCGNKIADDASFCHKCGTKVVRAKLEHQEFTTPEQTVHVLERKSKTGSSIAKFIKFGLAAIILLVLIMSGALRNVFDMLIDINREIENQSTGSYTVLGMQSAADLFPSTSDQADEPTANLTESSFAWVEEPKMITEDDFITSRYIVGSIENTSDITFLSASVEFALYDSSGNQIDTVYDYISNFKAGNIWKFKASVLSGDAAYFEFTQATKTY